MRLRAMTWNVNESSNGGGRIDAQVEVIATLEPDLVMLQAVRWKQWLPLAAGRVKSAQWTGRLGFRDAFTACNGTDLIDPEMGTFCEGCYSHLNPCGGSNPTRKRFDHVLATPELVPQSASYHLEVLEPPTSNGHRWSYVSDHAPLVVDFGVD